MRRVWMVAAASAALAAVLAVAAPARAEPAATVSGLRVEPGVVQFFLTATGWPAGAGLDRAAVTVTAGGVDLPARTEVVSATQTAAAPRRVTMLVLDTSGSMAGAPIAAARAAANEYAGALPADVYIGLVAVGTTARTVLAPTQNRGQLAASIAGLTATGETALYDGVREAALRAREGDYAQRRVVVLSDGADTESTTTLAQLRDGLAGGPPVDTVAFRAEEATTEVLADLSRRTAGRAFTAADPAALAAAFREAAAAFAVQLVVTATVPGDLAGSAARLTVSVGQGGVQARTEVPVTFAVDPAGAAPPLSTALSRVPWDALRIGILAMVFLALLLFGLVAFAPLLDLARHRRRVAQVDRFTVPRPPVVTEQQADDGNPVARAALALSEQVVRGGGLEDRLATQLDRAGMRLRPHEWLLVRAAAGFVALVLISLLVGPLLGLPLGLLAGWGLTALYQRNRAERRVRAFASLLPDALQLVIGSLRSGFALSQSIDAMVRELPDPIASEFGRALGETRLGVDLEDALSRVATRMRSADLAWAVVAIRVQREVGGNLAEILSTVVETMREREALRRHVRALSAEGRLSAWILLALPIIVGAFMFVVRQEYVRPLYTTPVGVLLLVGGIVLVAVGGFWLSRVVKVEV